MAKTDKEKNTDSAISRFIRDMRGEVKRIVWPSKKQVVNNTGIVIVFVVVASFFIGGFDLILSKLVTLLFGRV